MNNCAIIIFGMTGDLSKRKLIPALYRLVAQKKLDNFVIIGAAIDTITVDALLDRARPFIPAIDERVWNTLKANTQYQQLDFANSDDFKKLAQRVAELEQQKKLSGSRIVYLAAAAHYFCAITEHCAATGVARKLTDKDQIWHRMVYEKPFGHDAQSAHDINVCIAKSFYEHQIYRIDHYLTKELVSDIALVRFTNCVFEPLWNNRYIDQVQIMLSETVGLEGRGAYYDIYGALCDVVQNHMLELLALVGMEAPEKLTGDFIRSARAKVLERVRIVDGVFGQYEGYTKEKEVNAQSKTETFAMLMLMIDNPRWSGVPIYFKTGKCLNKKETVIHIKFKQVDCLLARNCPSDTNWLTFQVAPEETVSLSLNTKKPGTNDQLVQVAMEFCHKTIFGPQTPEAYEVLLSDIMRGEQSISVRSDEIEYAWRVIDAIKTMKLPLYAYKQGGTGPEEVEQFVRKHGMRWRS